MTGLPGYGAVAARLPIEQYVREAVAGTRVDPVLSAHLKDGWQAVRAINGSLQKDSPVNGTSSTVFRPMSDS